MNARQKAKKFKKELDFYKKSLFVPKVKVYNTDVKRYRVKQTVSTDDLHMMTGDAEDIHRYIYKSLTRQLAEAIINDVEFKQEPSMIPSYIDITGEIAIVTRRE